MDWCCSVWRESAERREAEAVNGTTKGSECVWFAFKHPGEEIANEISVTTSLAELLLAHAVSSPRLPQDFVKGRIMSSNRQAHMGKACWGLNRDSPKGSSSRKLPAASCPVLLAACWALALLLMLFTFAGAGGKQDAWLTAQARPCVRAAGGRSPPKGCFCGPTQVWCQTWAFPYEIPEVMPDGARAVRSGRDPTGDQSSCA